MITHLTINELVVGTTLFLSFNISNTTIAIAPTPTKVIEYSLNKIPDTIAVYISTKQNTA